MGASPEIEESEDEDPDEVYKVPVKAGGLNDFIMAAAARKEAAAIAVEIAAPDLPRDDQEEDDTDRHVGAMEAGDHEEGRAELRRSPWIAPRPHALVDQLAPFEGLHANEGRSENGGDDEQHRSLPAVVTVAEIDRHRHGPARG